MSVIIAKNYAQIIQTKNDFRLKRSIGIVHIIIKELYYLIINDQ